MVERSSSASIPGMSILELPKMSDLEEEILELMKEINPQTMYRLGFQELKERIFIPSKENIELVEKRIGELREKCHDDEAGILARKFLDSIRAVNSFEEPHPDIALVSDVFATHLIKEGVETATFLKLADQLISALDASLEKFEGKNFTTAVSILVQYQVIGAFEILDVVEYATKDKQLRTKLSELRDRVVVYSKRFWVEGFSDGEFKEVRRILKKAGSELGRSDFYPEALSKGFDYEESAEQLEEDALQWIEEDLPKLKKATEDLSRKLGCDNDPESVLQKLRAKPSFHPKDALATVLRIRPVIQDLVGQSIVGINPRYDSIVVETPSYLTPILPTGAAQEFDSFTDRPSQRFYLTTDPKRAPATDFADLVTLLVHEEYGHCVHASNTATHFAADPSLVEMLPSLHVGTTSEGLAFQRELEFLECLQKLARKLVGSELSEAEREFVSLTKQYGGFEQVLLEIEFSTYKQRIVRFLRVVGDVRINSGSQNLIDFLEWAEKETGLSQREVYYQLFPAHEGIFPGYATCYAVVGQQIREIQKPLSDNSDLLVKFNAYASSMGFPARSVYEKRLRKYASSLLEAVPEEVLEKEVVGAPPPILRREKTRKLVIPTPTLRTSRKIAKKIGAPKKASRRLKKLVKSTRATIEERNQSSVKTRTRARTVRGKLSSRKDAASAKRR